MAVPPGATAPVRAAPGRRRRVAAGAAGLAVAAWLAIWMFGNPFHARRAPTEPEARAYLARAVDYALRGHFDRLCRLNGASGHCYYDLDANGARATVPETPPDSITARFLPTGPDRDIASWLLTVEGRDGTDRRYRTEMLVFRDHEGHLKAINVVWWSGNGVGEATPLDPPS